MQTEDRLRWIAIGCALVLLLALFGDRTSLVEGNTTTIDSAGYNVATFLCGFVAITGLAVAFRLQSSAVPPVLGGVTAIGAFGAAAFVCGIYWLALSSGDALDGRIAASDAWRVSVYPARGPLLFAIVGLVGGAAALALVFGWLRRRDGNEPTHANQTMRFAVAAIAFALLLAAGWVFGPALF